MATYAAVASLLQTLDYLLQFPRFILELKILHVEVLKPKLDEILLLTRDLRFSEPNIDLLQRLIEELDSLLWLIEETDSSLACGVRDIIEAVKEGYRNFFFLSRPSNPSKPVLINVRIAIMRGVMSFTSSTSSTIPKLVEAEQIVGYFKRYKEKLGNFLHRINPYIYENLELKGSPWQAGCTHGCGAISLPTKSPYMLCLPGNPLDREQHLFLEHFNPHLQQISLPTLCWTCQLLSDTNSSLVKGTREITDLQQDLLFLLNFVKKDPSNHKCYHDHDLLKKLANVADRVRDLVEEHMVDSQINSAMKYTFCLLVKIRQQFPPYTKHLGRAVEEIFNREKGIGQCLEQASKEIQLIKESITRINDETPSLQTSISSMSLRHSNREDIVVGLDDELISLLDGLTRIPSGLEIVTILGMGGIGKTTLARKIFHHSRTAYHFHCRAWITVSQVYIVRDLLLGLLGSLAVSTDNMDNAQLADVLRKSLKGMRYLIVMDDMWNIDAWNDIRICFPDDKNGSRIIVTSRVRKLAVYINPKKSPYCMNPLDAEQSWQLLHKLVFGKESCPPGLVKIGKHIAKRCHGLPLAIVVIAGVLSRVIRMYECWNDIAEKLTSFVSTNPEECLDILALSYDFLPHHLKACFLYMAAFPEDCEIEVPKLINLWAAEGFLDSQSSIDLEQIAEEYLEDLIGRNLVLIEKKCFGGKVKTCRLHDFLRELGLREAQKENFMHVIQKRGAKRSPVSLRNQRRLSFHLDPYCDVPAAPAVPHLSSFLCFTLGANIVPDILFFQLGFKILRVLDIFFLILEYFPEPILELIHLRYLALNVTYELPASVSELRNLQTLVINGPWHRRESGSYPTLLLEYWSMPSLRHLHCTVAIHIKDPPRARNQLPQLFVPEYLRTLSTVRFSSCTKEVFSIMPHLKKLGICETEEGYSKDGPSELLENLQYLTELETLDCCFYKQKGEARLISCLSAFPSTLRELSLSWSYLPWEDMTSIAKLPRLEVLKLKNFAFQGPKWEPKEEGFRSLKHLLIENTDLVHWEATADHFPCLEHLVLKSCKLLDEIPFGVEEIGTLLRIELYYCSEATEIAAREIQAQIEGIEVIISEWNQDSA